MLGQNNQQLLLTHGPIVRVSTTVRKQTLFNLLCCQPSWEVDDFVYAKGSIHKRLRQWDLSSVKVLWIAIRFRDTPTLQFCNCSSMASQPITRLLVVVLLLVTLMQLLTVTSKVSGELWLSHAMSPARMLLKGGNIICSFLSSKAWSPLSSN
jgi:hypothetical protein